MGIYLGAPKPLIRSYLATRSTFTLINFSYYLKTRWVPRVKSFCICPDLKVISFQNMASDMIYIKVSSFFFGELVSKNGEQKSGRIFQAHNSGGSGNKYWNLVIRKRCEIPIDVVSDPTRTPKSSCIFQIGFQAFPVPLASSHIKSPLSVCVSVRGLCHGEKETHKNVQTSSR